VSVPPSGADIFFTLDQSQTATGSASSGSAHDVARAATSLRRVTGSGDGDGARFTEPEHWALRLAFAAVLLAILVGFWTITQQFRTPAHGGADQNGYLVGGKMLGEHFSAAQSPPDAP